MLTSPLIFITADLIKLEATRITSNYMDTVFFRLKFNLFISVKNIFERWNVCQICT